MEQLTRASLGALDAKAPPQPTFLYIGAPKAGSTWILHVLNDHPDVYVPPAKDLLFFNYRYHRGLDWYLRHFKNADGARAVGEVAHEYYLSPEVAQRIRAHFPDVRLICCLREPGDFAVSLLQWWRNHTLRYGSTFDDMTRHPLFISAISYLKNLKVYFDLFPRDQILVVFFEELRANPQKLTQNIYEFIGVDRHHHPKDMSERKNPTSLPRNRMLSHLAVAAGEIFGWLGATNFVGTVRQSRLFNEVMYSRASHNNDDALTAKLQQIAKDVRSQMAGDADALARLIGRPLPPEWLLAMDKR